MADPLRPPRGAPNLGAAGLARTHATGDRRWEIGTVVAYNSATHTSVVRTDNGRPLQDVPQLRSTAGGFDHLQTGTSVVVSWDLGFPMIVGVLDLVGPPQTAIPAPTLTGVEGVGSDDPTQPTQGTNNYKPPYAPSDMSGGDWAQVGTLGNHVAVLEGGVSLIGSPTAQLQSIGTTGLLRGVARSLQAVSDFGTWRTENLEGRTSFVLRAGSNQSTQTGVDEQHWTIRLDLGATGDMLDFRIQEPEGKTLFRLHAGSDGRVQLYGDGGVDVSSGQSGASNMRSDVAGARSVSVAGDDDHVADGDVTSSVGGSITSSAAGDITHATGGDYTTYAGGDRTHGVAGDATCVVGGDRTSTTGGQETRSSNKAMKLSTKQGFEASAVSAMTLSAGSTAKLTGASVVLGPNGGHPAPLFDVFLRDLGMFLADLTSALGSVVPSNPFALAAAVAKITAFAAKVSVSVPYVSRTVRND